MFDAAPASQFVDVTIEGGGRAVETHRAGIAAWYGPHLERLSRSRYVDYPNQVGIESRAVCNATCSFCPYPTMRRRGERMPDALVEKILGELEDLPADLPFDVNLARMNEPFADRRVLDIAGEINRRTPQASLWFFTNASPLVPRVAERLRDLQRVGQFVISLNEHREREYERVMGLSFARTVANLDHLHEMEVSGELPCTPLVSKVADGTLADEGFLEWVAARWPRFESRVTGRFDWRGDVRVDRVGEIPATGCVQWFHLPILASGRVAWCTLDHEGALAWGDANDAHILEIYNHPVRRSLRQRIPDRGEEEACRACSHYG